MSGIFLRRCPFCGGKPRHGKGMKRKAATLYQQPGEWVWKPFVGCAPCHFYREFNSVEDAAEWWNGNGVKKAAK